MNASAERLEFAPPPTPGLVRGLGLAILAHAFLVAGLTWGVRWKQAPITLSAEAELWAAVPRQAAPPPPPVEAAPLPPPAPPPPAQTATPSLPDPQIAIERERQRQQKDKQLAADKLERDKRDKLRKAQEKQQALDKQRELEQQRELEKRLAADKQKAALEARRKDELKAQQEANKKLEAQRQANLQRMAGLAGSAGAPSSTGTAAQAAGPSASYAGRVKSMMKKIYLPDSNTGNLKTDVEFQTRSDGTIVSLKVVNSSGNRVWDNALLKEWKEIGALPRDVDGRIPPSPLVISFSP